MINEINEKLKGVAMVFDEGPLQILEFARKAQQGLQMYSPGQIGKLHENSWERLAVADPEKIKTVEEMVEELNELRDFAPPSLNKRRRWNEVDGTLDVDRAMEGDSTVFRKSTKCRTTGPTNITILANLDGEYDQSAESIFWRGAMAVALSSMLDGLGYVTAVWSWNVGSNVFKSPNSNQFTACLLKESGTDLDPISLINCLNKWFMTNVMFATFVGGAARCESIGSPNHKLGGWDEYLDLEGDHVIKLPAVFDKTDCIIKTLIELNRISNVS